MNKILKTCAVISSGLFFSVSGLAAKWDADFGLQLSTAYDDNFLMEDDEQDTWEYLVTPSVSFNYDSQKATSSLSLIYVVNRYSEFDEFDSEDPFLTWGASYQTERLRWRINAGYSESSQRDFADEDTGEFDSNTEVETISVSPSVDIQVTQNDFLGITLGYSERNYDANDFADNENESASLEWRHQVSKKLATLLTTSYAEYSSTREFVEDSDTEYVQVQAGFDYKFSETKSLNAYAGYFESDRERVVFTLPANTLLEEDNTGTILGAKLNSKQEQSEWYLSLSRSLYPSSQGEVEERDAVSFSWDYNLSERSSVGFTGSWTETDSTQNGRTVIRFSPSYSYKLTRKIIVEASYQYRQFDPDAGVRTESNRVLVGLDYNF